MRRHSALVVFILSVFALKDVYGVQAFEYVKFLGLNVDPIENSPGVESEDRKEDASHLWDADHDVPSGSRVERSPEENSERSVETGESSGRSGVGGHGPGGKHGGGGPDRRGGRQREGCGPDGSGRPSGNVPEGANGTVSLNSTDSTNAKICRGNGGRDQGNGSCRGNQGNGRCRNDEDNVGGGGGQNGKTTTNIRSIAGNGNCALDNSRGNNGRANCNKNNNKNSGGDDGEGNAERGRRAIVGSDGANVSNAGDASSLWGKIKGLVEEDNGQENGRGTGQRGGSS